jgi:ribosomal protein S18 acetylase RimI-like enzyme
LAIGRAALAGGSRSWVGLAGIETAPNARRRGLARLILSTLLRWAAEQGAERVMLEVRRENEAAITLYRQLGFATAHEYHYRMVTEAVPET